MKYEKHTTGISHTRAQYILHTDTIFCIPYGLLDYGFGALRIASELYNLLQMQMQMEVCYSLWKFLSTEMSVHAQTLRNVLLFSIINLLLITHLNGSADSTSKFD
jgi:hypothetical protein